MDDEVPDHEEVVVRRGRRSGLPVVVAVHSTARGPALGGCRLRRYRGWRDGVEDALRLAAGMTAKSAAAGLRFGGGKTVVGLPDRPLPADRRRAVLLDVGDAVAALGGRYLVGPDSGTAPADMAVIAERTRHVLCTPTGSGDPAPHTARAALACVRAVCRHRTGSPDLAGRRVVVIGLGHVGEPLARMLAAAGCRLVLSDVDPARRALATELGAGWCEPADAWREPAELLVPAAVGAGLTPADVDRVRCDAIVGPANDQLADASVAAALHARGVLWAPDHLVGAGGIVHATAVEIDGAGPDEVAARLDRVGDTLAGVLARADRDGVGPSDVGTVATSDGPAASAHADPGIV